MSDKAIGYICATMIGIALLMVDGMLAIGYCLAIGANMVGLEVGQRYYERKAQAGTDPGNRTV